MKKIDTIKDKLQGKISSKKSKWLDDAKYSEENEAWLERSAQIALKILRHLRANKISQIKLAESLLVSPQYVSKIVKGKENLSLETISKIEKALGISLIEVLSFENRISVSDSYFRNQRGISRLDATNMFKGSTVYSTYENYSDSCKSLKSA